MTYCETLVEPIIRKVEKEEKNLDEIANELCTSVKNPRQKTIRIIRELLGEEYLIEHAKTLKYDVEKAKLGKKAKAPTLRKIKTATDSDSSASAIKPKSEVHTEPKKIDLKKILISLTREFGFFKVLNALKELGNEDT
jgi:hypothetical protein